MPNETIPPPPTQVVMDFGSIDPIYWMIIIVLVFTTILMAMMWVYRGMPTVLAKANLFKKDILFLSMANNRWQMIIPKVVQGNYYVKGNKKLESINGYFKINPDSLVSFDRTNACLANSHQAMTQTSNSMELMTMLQNEKHFGLRINKYDDIDVIVKYGEMLAAQENNTEKSIVDKTKSVLDIKKDEKEENLKIRFKSLVEQMQNLDHLKPFTEEPKPREKGDPPLLEMFTKEDRERLKTLIEQTRDENDLLKDVSKKDLELLTRVEGQMVRGQTTALRSIRGFLDGDMEIPTPKTMSVLVQNRISKLTKMQDYIKPVIIIGGLLMGFALVAAIIFYIITGQA